MQNYFGFHHNCELNQKFFYLIIHVNIYSNLVSDAV
jgi:hypothetical protein